MQRLLLATDRLSTAIGQIFAWSIVVLTGIIVFEVISRYFFNSPNAWVFDASYMAYGTLFMMAGAYTLAKNGHVRGDVLYGFFQPRTQAFFDLLLYIVFFIPGVVALAWAGYTFAAESWAINEHSSVTANGPPIYPFKTIIPIAGGLLLLQGVAEIIRCVMCLRTGEWPSREQDVEEVDVEKLKAMVTLDDPDSTESRMATVALSSALAADAASVAAHYRETHPEGQAEADAADDDEPPARRAANG